MSSTSRSIGVIVGSTREPRVCPQIAAFVADTVKLQSKHSTKVELTIIDLQKWNLPMYDEPGIPSQILDYNEYKHEHTRAWSKEIQQHDAFIFVVPQYNWGYPAAVKNAIDYLFNEWKGKSAMVVSYGGHGGDKCNAQLRQVLLGLRMSVVQTPVELTFPSRGMLVEAAKGQDIKLDARSNDSAWTAEKKTILTAYDELLDLLSG